MFPKISSRISLSIVLTGAVANLSACDGSGLADSPTSSYTGNVRNGVVSVSLDSESNGSVSDSRVGLVAFVTGIDTSAGQIEAVAGIEGTPNVGPEVTSRVVQYDTRYNFGLVDSIFRSDATISGRTTTLARDGTTVLVADFGAGTLNGGDSVISVNGQINGQNVSGTTTIVFPTLSSISTDSIDADLNGRIGANGVIATFDGADSNTVVAGGLVGTAN